MWNCFTTSYQIDASNLDLKLDRFSLLIVFWPSILSSNAEPWFWLLCLTSDSDLIQAFGLDFGFWCLNMTSDSCPCFWLLILNSDSDVWFWLAAFGNKFQRGNCGRAVISSGSRRLFSVVPWISIRTKWRSMFLNFFNLSLCFSSVQNLLHFG